MLVVEDFTLFTYYVEAESVMLWSIRDDHHGLVNTWAKDSDYLQSTSRQHGVWDLQDCVVAGKYCAD